MEIASCTLDAADRSLMQPLADLVSHRITLADKAENGE